MAAAGAVLLVAAGIGAVVSFAGDDSGSAQGASPQPAPNAEQVRTKEVHSKRDGVVLAHPADWRRSKRDGFLSLESPDRCTVISLAAPAERSEAKGVREDTIAVLQVSFKQSEVRRARAQTLGGRPTTGAIVAVRNKQGLPVVIRVAVSEGTELAHLTEVVLRAPPCEAAAPATAQILGSIEFRR